VLLLSGGPFHSGITAHGIQKLVSAGCLICEGAGENSIVIVGGANQTLDAWQLSVDAQKVQTAD
jgi:hypothetical protein